MKRWLRNPLVIVALGVLLVWEVRTLPAARGTERYSIIGAFVRDEVLGQRKRPWIGVQSGVAWLPHLSFGKDEDGRLQRLDPGSPPFQPVANAKDSRITIRSVWYEREMVERGLWRPTVRRTEHRLHIEAPARSPSDPYPITAEDIAEMRRQFVAHLKATYSDDGVRLARGEAATPNALWDGVARNAARLERRDFTERKVLWAGVARNVGMLAALVVWVYSLGWIPMAIRSRKRRRRERRGRCAGCGYERAGLGSGKCPECGEEWKDKGLNSK